MNCDAAVGWDSEEYCDNCSTNCSSIGLLLCNLGSEGMCVIKVPSKICTCLCSFRLGYLCCNVDYVLLLSRDCSF